MKKYPVYILSGGFSSRFGRDKALVPVDGLPLLMRVAEQLKPIASQITSVADRPGKYDELGIQTIGDIEPHLGPLGGLKTALSHLRESSPTKSGGWLFLSACDLLGIRQSWLELLSSNLRAEKEALAVVFGHPLEPLFGFYHTDSLPLIDPFLYSENRSMKRFLSSIGTAVVPKPADWSELFVINRPSDLEAYLNSAQKKIGHQTSQQNRTGGRR